MAASTTEAEYIALSEAVKEAIWIRRLLTEIGSRAAIQTQPSADSDSYHNNETRKQWEDLEDRQTADPSNAEPTQIAHPAPQVIYADNQASIKLAQNPQSHDRTKHIDIKFHIVREALGNNTIALKYVPTADMTADILTKGLPKVTHEHHAQGMGLASWLWAKD